jgi:hypothetical protein
MRSCFRNRARDRGGEPIRLGLVLGHPDGKGLPHAETRTAPSREWKDDDYDVLADGEIVGHIFNAGVSVARPWMWTLDIGHQEHRSPTHGYAATREAAMAAFAKSWRHA